jgi:hypothetical protein
MVDRRSVTWTALAIILLVPLAAAHAQDTKKYPDWEGFWKRGSPVNGWDPTKPPGLAQEAPVTPEYQAIHEANVAKARPASNSIRRLPAAQSECRA